MNKHQIFFAGGHILGNNYERNIKLGKVGNGQGAGALVRRRQKSMQSYPPCDNL